MVLAKYPVGCYIPIIWTSGRFGGEPWSILITVENRYYMFNNFVGEVSLVPRRIPRLLLLFGSSSSFTAWRTLVPKRGSSIQSRMRCKSFKLATINIPIYQSCTPSASSNNQSQMDSNSSLDRETRNKDDEGDLQTPDSNRVKRKATPVVSGATSQARTSNLKKHHEICKEHKAWKAGQADKQDVINKEGKLKKARFTDSMFREATNEMLVWGQKPLAFVESVAWKHFCNKIQHLF
ncbi:Uncharacterized protein Rs2_04827 [Raphanus sativus]|nr:Uncharacterized protein Rs2_04827 [Raphanus sativus]